MAREVKVEHISGVVGAVATHITCARRNAQTAVMGQLLRLETIIGYNVQKELRNIRMLAICVKKL